MKRICILGSTGSIGLSTLNVIESNPERFQIIALAAGKNLNAAFDQAVRWKPRLFRSLQRTMRESCAAVSSPLAKIRLKSFTVLPGPCWQQPIPKLISWLAPSWA